MTICDRCRQDFATSQRREKAHHMSINPRVASLEAVDDHFELCQPCAEAVRDFARGLLSSEKRKV